MLADQRVLAAAHSFASEAEVDLQQRDASRSKLPLQRVRKLTRPASALRRPQRTSALYATRCDSCVSGGCATRS